MGSENLLRTMLGRKLTSIFIVVFPPAGEECIADIDISFGMRFAADSNEIFLITTDHEDNWSPLVKEIDVLNIFDWKDFHSRMDSWMNDELFGSVEYEFYDVTHESIFKNLVGVEIESIEYIGAKNTDEPFGVKFQIGDDYLISFSNTNGNMIETSNFKIGRKLSVFEQFGELEFSDVKP